MASKYSKCVETLINDNNQDTIKITSSLLLKIACNILNSPNEERYRRIKTSKKIFLEKLLPISGAVECLLEMGFVEDDDQFVLHPDSSLELVTMIKNQLHTLSTGTIDNNTAAKPSKSEIVLSPVTQTPSINPLAVTNSQGNIKKKITSHFHHSLIFEDPLLQQKAIKLIPIEIIEKQAKIRLEKHFMFVNRSGLKSKCNFQDCLLLELINWFKKDFFTWTDNPKCDRCGSQSTVNCGMLMPSSDEVFWQAGRVEGYKCQMCNVIIRFPRYNHPEKLLETRTGRCGEWANCFTLLCRAMKFEARHVLDFTDHVWTEVYSTSANRWLHCDPCENACDKPLLYEKGWGKNLSLIIAASCDEIVDVTWRYVAKNVTQVRANMFSEKWLTEILINLTKQRQSGWIQSKIDAINKRYMHELVEFITPRSQNNQNYAGRTTGSLAWRQTRGELGELKDTANNYIKPSAAELKNGVLLIQYFCSKDVYIQSHNKTVHGWESLVHKFNNMDRKEEMDWKMVYLAREEGSNQQGFLNWKILLESEEYCIDKAEILTSSKTFESGDIKWILCTDTLIRKLDNNGENKLGDLSSNLVSIYATVAGGNGACAWQHAQLFRQSNEDHKVSFQIKIYFKRKS